MQIEKTAEINELFQQMIKEIRRGTVDKKHPFRFVTVATCKDNIPNQRMVVLRQVTEAEHFIIYTDFRTPKVEEILSNDNCHLLFWNERKKLQLRVGCKAVIQNRARENYQLWKNIPAYSRKEYLSNQIPGAEVNQPAQGWQFNEEGTGDNFTLIKFIPLAYDLLQLDRNGHLRLKFIQKDGQWQGNWVQP